MRGSIRWRLVASYSLLVLLTVAVVGLLALYVFSRHAEARRQEQLVANAEAVARQALPLMQSPDGSAALAQLASTSAFLASGRVRVLGADGAVRADSGPRGTDHQLLWVTRWHNQDNGPAALSPLQEGVVVIGAPGDSTDVGALRLPGAAGVPQRPSEPAFDRISEAEAERLQQLAREVRLLVAQPDAVGGADADGATQDVVVVRRFESVWGDRFTFDVRVEADAEARQVIVPGGTGPTAVSAGPDGVAARSAQIGADAVTVPIGAASAPHGFVELSGTPDYGAEALAATGRAFGVASLVATLLAVTLGLVVSRGLTAPLAQLTSATARMGDGDLSVRAAEGRSDELGQLAVQFNRMAAQLEDSFAVLERERDALRRFIADASHELRTPITALRTFNELLRDGADDDVAAREEFLALSALQLRRLEWITGHLLDLSRLEAGLVALDVRPHDVGELLEEAVAGFRARAAESGVTLEVVRPARPRMVRADRGRVVMALGNLIDNALKFTPAGGVVTVAAVVGDGDAGNGDGEADGDGNGEVRLVVRDTGPGVDPEERARVFERFYRGRGAEAVEGSGLGLALVREVARAHGGTVTVEGVGDGAPGSVFTLVLPTRGWRDEGSV